MFKFLAVLFALLLLVLPATACPTVGVASVGFSASFIATPFVPATTVFVPAFTPTFVPAASFAFAPAVIVRQRAFLAAFEVRPRVKVRARIEVSRPAVKVIRPAVVRARVVIH